MSEEKYIEIECAKCGSILKAYYYPSADCYSAFCPKCNRYINLKELHCPSCGKYTLHRLTKLEHEGTATYYIYQCLECGHEKRVRSQAGVSRSRWMMSHG